MAEDRHRHWLLKPGDHLNNTYKIRERLGDGGMGSVFLGHSLAFDEDVVAIKVILPERARDETFLKLFMSEARTLLKVRHPNIVGYRGFSHDRTLDLHYIVTDFVDGVSLEEHLEKGPLSASDLDTLALSIIDGLKAVHAAGVIHRDLSPDNIILEDGDIAKARIIDFGVAKDTGSKHTTVIGDKVVGKLDFMAPEQLGKPRYEIGPWTDIYSLGLVLLAAYRGEVTDLGDTFAEAIDMRQAPIDMADISPGAQAFLSKLLATHPKDRPQTMVEVAELLSGPRRAMTVLAPEPQAASEADEPDPQRQKPVDAQSGDAQPVAAPANPEPGIAPNEPAPIAPAEPAAGEMLERRTEGLGQSGDNSRSTGGSAPTGQDSEMGNLPIIAGIAMIVVLMGLALLVIFSGGDTYDEDTSEDQFAAVGEEPVSDDIDPFDMIDEEGNPLSAQPADELSETDVETAQEDNADEPVSEPPDDEPQDTDPRPGQIAQADPGLLPGERLAQLDQPNRTIERPQPARLPPPDCNTGPYLVYFDFEESAITAQAATILDFAVTAYANCGSARARLRSYADSQSEEENVPALARRRLAAVRSYLSGKGIPSGRIAGSTVVPDPNRGPANAAIRAQSMRRVELIYAP